ncbi:MAG: type II pantothenate kinase [Clostridia bacterium]|nr:type II pantothenate kinase [Clostridia bacterium]
MKNKIVIGIDIGGSTTKIVGFRKSGSAKKLIDPLFVKATDPITSMYGALGRFTNENGLELSDIERIMVTGAGSSYLKSPLYSLPCYIIPEFRSIGLGGLYLCGYSEAIIASMGTGTAIIYAKEGEEPKHLGGTGIGGGTLVGLSKKMLGMDTVEHIEELAKGGNLRNIDLRIEDITGHDLANGFSDVMTASNFGKISDIATKSDIALGIINMVFETVGMISIFAARTYGIKDVVLTGNLTSVSIGKDIIELINKMFDMRFIIPKHSQYGTVIGAALSEYDESLRIK